MSLSFNSTHLHSDNIDQMESVHFILCAMGDNIISGIRTSENGASKCTSERVKLKNGNEAGERGGGTKNENKLNGGNK